MVFQSEGGDRESEQSTMVKKKLKFQSPRYPNIHSSPYLEKLLAKTDIVGWLCVRARCLYLRSWSLRSGLQI